MKPKLIETEFSIGEMVIIDDQEQAKVIWSAPGVITVEFEDGERCAYELVDDGAAGLWYEILNDQVSYTIRRIS